MGERRLRSFIQTCRGAWIATGFDCGTGRAGRCVSDLEGLPGQKAHRRGLQTAEVLSWQEGN
eukprot:219890-Pleurochrysis_carterae.AAC.1